MSALAGFGVLCGLAAHNAVVAAHAPTTVQQQSPAPPPAAPDNGGFFNGDNGQSAPQVGPGNGSSPSLGSGAS